MVLRDTYGNTKDTGFTIDFFSLSGPGAGTGLLASPFYSTYEPVRLLTERGCKVRLLVRLCEITTPEALRRALQDPDVTVRYYTSQNFHAKLYIIDDRALIGSANLTTAGLQANREVSVVLERGRDPGFDDLPGLFDLLWDHADTLTDSILERFARVYGHFKCPDENAFERALASEIDTCEPPSVRVTSGKTTRRRSFLQSFRRKYDEVIHPAFSEVREVFVASGTRRPEFEHGDMNVEISRFLGWLRIVHAPGESWREVALLSPTDRKARIEAYRQDWATTSDITNGDMIVAHEEIANVERIRTALGSEAALNSLTYDELFDTLLGCHAFLELMRFTNGGLPGLRKDFQARNRLAAIQKTLAHLSLGGGDPLERAYDCLYDPQYRLGRFAEACVMELLGWVAPGYPPINGRTIKALRFLGYDVASASGDAG